MAPLQPPLHFLSCQRQRPLGQDPHVLAILSNTQASCVGQEAAGGGRPLCGWPGPCDLSGVEGFEGWTWVTGMLVSRQEESCDQRALPHSSLWVIPQPRSQLSGVPELCSETWRCQGCGCALTPESTLSLPSTAP